MPCLVGNANVACGLCAAFAGMSSVEKLTQSLFKGESSSVQMFETSLNQVPLSSNNWLNAAKEQLPK